MYSKTFVSINHRKSRRPFVKNVFLPFKTVLWFHGIPFTNKSFWKSSIALKVASVLLALFFDLITVFRMYMSFHYFFQFYNKSDLANIALIGMNWVLKIMFYVKMKDLKAISNRLAAFYANISKDKLLVRKILLKVVALAFYTESMTMVYLACVIHKNQKLNFPFLFISPPHSVTVYNIIFFLGTVGLVQPVVTCYFCTLTLLLKGAISEFKKRIQTLRHVDIEVVIKFHNEFMDLAAAINEAFHPLFAMGFCLQLFRVYKSAYTSIFVLKGDPLLLFRTLVLFSDLALICILGSVVLDASSSLKGTLRTLPSLNKANSDNIFLIQKTNDEFDGFKLFNTIVINSTLILSVLGSLATYGIMISTFSVSLVSGEK